jgi:hypothetical protein
MGNVLITNATKGDLKISFTGPAALVGIFPPDTKPYQFMARYMKGSTLSITSVDGVRGQTFGEPDSPQGIPINSKITVRSANDGGYSIVTENLVTSPYGSEDKIDINDNNKDKYAVKPSPPGSGKPPPPGSGKPPPPPDDKPPQPPGSGKPLNLTAVLLGLVIFIILLLILAIAIKFIKKRKAKK